MKTKLLLIQVFSIAYLTLGYSQSVNILWEQGFGGNDDEIPNDIIQTADSGFLAIGNSESSDGDITGALGGQDFWIVKINAGGEIEWQKSYGGSGFDYCESVCNAFDGGYVLAGGSGSSDGDVTNPMGSFDVWIIKINDLGDLQWQKSIGGSMNDYAKSIIQTNDSCYVVSGYSRSTDGSIVGNHGNTNDFFVAKIEINGDLIFANCYGSFDYDDANDVTQTSDNGFVLTGFAGESSGDVTGSYGGTDMWVIKIDSVGNLLWEKNFGGSEYDYGSSILEMGNGNILIAGTTHSDDGLITDSHGFFDCWIICLDNLGNLLWQNCYGGTGGDGATDIIYFSSNNYVFVGCSATISGDVTSNNGITDSWAVCIDTLGEILWQKSFGGSEYEAAYACVLSNDSSIVIASHSYSSDFDVTETYNSDNYWVVKLKICSDHYFADLDEDGYGDILSDSFACEQPPNYVLDSMDCNDLNNLIHPGLPDICNAIDDNCNGTIDEDATFIIMYKDLDDDGFGNELADSSLCSELPGYVFDSTDCDDNNSEINPAITELCNQIDDNCNESIDEGLVFSTYYFDSDNDNFGNSDIDSLSCSAIADYVIDSTDCDDSNPNIYPGATEILNGMDDDCDGLTDEKLAITNELFKAFKIYPNPTENILTIDYFEKKNVEIEIFNNFGQSIYVAKLTSFPVEIFVGRYVPGIYLLNVQMGAEEMNIPFIKE